MTLRKKLAKLDENTEISAIQGAKYSPLRMTSDKPAVVRFNKPATNIVVPNKDHAVIRPDTWRKLIIQPRNLESFHDPIRNVIARILQTIYLIAAWYSDHRKVVIIFMI